MRPSLSRNATKASSPAQLSERRRPPLPPHPRPPPRLRRPRTAVMQTRSPDGTTKMQTTRTSPSITAPSTRCFWPSRRPRPRSRRETTLCSGCPTPRLGQTATAPCRRGKTNAYMRGCSCARGSARSRKVSSSRHRQAGCTRRPTAPTSASKLCGRTKTTLSTCRASTAPSACLR